MTTKNTIGYTILVSIFISAYALAGVPFNLKTYGIVFSTSIGLTLLTICAGQLVKEK